MDLSELLNFHEPVESQEEKRKKEFQRYWKLHPFNLYRAGVPVVNNYPRHYKCWSLIEEGIKLIIVLSNGYKEKVTEETFTEAIGGAVSSPERTHP